MWGTLSFFERHANLFFGFLKDLPMGFLFHFLKDLRVFLFKLMKDFWASLLERHWVGRGSRPSRVPTAAEFLEKVVDDK